MMEILPPACLLWPGSPQTLLHAPVKTIKRCVDMMMMMKSEASLFVSRGSRCSHHLPLLLQDDGLPRPLPQAQGLVVGRGHDVVAVGADGQTPDLAVVTLQGGGEKPQSVPATRIIFLLSSQVTTVFPATLFLTTEAK